MALGSKSLFNYGIQVTSLNCNLDFKNQMGGSTLTAVLSLGFYSPQGLANEIATQLQSLDSVNVYTVTVNRNIMGGLQNRITIATNGSFLQLLFGSGPNVNSSCASLAGFNQTDYTGATSYTGSQTTGIILIPDFVGYNYLNNFNTNLVFGAVNVSASGVKESVTFSIQKFIFVEFMYEKKSNLLAWNNLFSWMIQQRQFDFTPEIFSPDTFFTVTLEQTDFEGQGLGYQMLEMLPDFPNDYQTGSLKFRIIESLSRFLPPG